MMDNLTIRFRLFDIPIAIHPSVFLILLFLGGGLHIEEEGGLNYTLVFVVTGLACLLCHELGHALCAKYGYGAQSSIVLDWGGGVTCPDRPAPTRALSIAMSIAGPLATLIPMLVSILILGLKLGDFNAAWLYIKAFSVPFVEPESVIPYFTEESLEIIITMGQVEQLLYALPGMIGIFWAAINLLPAFPLDGGHVLLELTNNRRLCRVVGIVTCCVAGILLAVWTHSAYNFILFAWLAWLNYKLLQPSS